MDHVVPESRCPRCGAPHDRAMNVTGESGPEPGDYTVCFRCAALLRYGAGLSLRSCTRREWKEAPEEIRLAAMRAALTILEHRGQKRR